MSKIGSKVLELQEQEDAAEYYQPSRNSENEDKRINQQNISGLTQGAKDNHVCNRRMRRTRILSPPMPILNRSSARLNHLLTTITLCSCNRSRLARLEPCR